MLQVVSILLMIFGGMMLAGSAAVTLIVPPPEYDWWAWKLGILATVGAMGGVPMAIAALMRPRETRARDTGIAMLVTAGMALMEMYVIGGLFGTNEEVRRIDPKFAMEARDYALCSAVIALQAAIGGGCLYFGTRPRSPVEAYVP